MIWLKRPYIAAEGGVAQSTHLQEAAIDTPFDEQTILYIPLRDGGDWVGYRDAPNLPDPAKDVISDVFSEKWGVDVRFATETENEQLTRFYEADREDRVPKADLPR